MPPTAVWAWLNARKTLPFLASRRRLFICAIRRSMPPTGCSSSSLLLCHSACLPLCTGSQQHPAQSSFAPGFCCRCADRGCSAYHTCQILLQLLVLLRSSALTLCGFLLELGAVAYTPAVQLNVLALAIALCSANLCVL